MLIRIFIVCLPVVATVAIHAVGFAVLLRAMIRSHALDQSGFRPVTGLVVVLTCWLVVVHLAEIAVWGLFYFWQECMPDVWTGFYFSAVTYTGFGDSQLVLPGPWRMLGPLEAMTATLMYGLSTGLFFALVSGWHRNWVKRRNDLEPQAAGPKSR
jgi:hypothetical protein